MLILWIKAFHIIFVVCWFAGIFYLPRLFVYYAMSEHTATRQQLLVMQRKLYRFITPFAWLAIGMGIVLFSMNAQLYVYSLWFWSKIALVALLAIYHLICGKTLQDFASGKPPRSHIYYRWFNEAPVIALFGIVILVVIKPF